jgi:hypothetical protein
MAKDPISRTNDHFLIAICNEVEVLGLKKRMFTGYADTFYTTNSSILGF